MSNCIITLKPYPQGRLIDRMDVTYALDALERKTGEEVMTAYLEVVSIPAAEPENVCVMDAAGEVPLTISESQPYPYHLRHFAAARDMQGAVTIRYTVRPRVLDDKAACGPYFDLRTEDGGANSAGQHFLVDVKDLSGHFELKWDMSEMPANARGVCTWGEGDIAYDGRLDKLRGCYYAFGDIKQCTEGDFGFYWLSETTFDVQAIADYTRQLFGVMQRFFDDHEPVYRIFVRKDPFLTSGGTALQRSYMFGWNDTQPVSVRDKQNILAHEMVHNWPSLNDNPYGTSSWYSEGTAEFYSIMIPLREGLIDLPTALDEIQKRTDAYYTNPTRHMENIEAARICWKDRRAQRLPYGRGIFFLANTDVKMRQATNGEKTIDDAVLHILQLEREGVTLGNEVFLNVVKELSGVDVREDWEAMRTGGHIVPLDDCFDGHFHVEATTVPEADTGVSVTSYAWSIRD